MAKRKRKFTTTTLKRWLKEGRGQGAGEAYKPWYTIQDVASYGLSHRIKSVWTTGRETHLFSNLERDWFYIFDWSPQVIDIREQFPLLPLRETQAIALECNVQHPYERRTKKGYPIVLTSDFRLTVKGKQGTYEQIRTVKFAHRLNNRRVLEKFEVERRYWERRGVEWGILTEKDLPIALARNIAVLRGKRSLAGYVNLERERLLNLVKRLTERVTSEAIALREITKACDRQFGLEKGTALTVVYYLLANRYWEIDMRKAINPGHRMIILRQDIQKMMRSEF